MKCEWCGKQCVSQYDRDYVQVVHYESWAYPDGQCGNATKLAAIYCSTACAGASLQSVSFGGTLSPLSKHKSSDVEAVSDG